MTPGAYIRECREAAGLSVDELALFLDSVPRVPARRRAEVLSDLEAGLTLVGVSAAFALAAVPMLGINLDRLAELVDADQESVRLTPTGRTMILQGSRS